jgi:hypothetical protein
MSFLQAVQLYFGYFTPAVNPVARCAWSRHMVALWANYGTTETFLRMGRVQDIADVFKRVSPIHVSFFSFSSIFLINAELKILDIKK